MRFLLAFLMMLVSLPALAAGGGIVIEQPSTIALPAGVPTAGVYMVIKNTGDKDDALVSVSSPRTSQAEMHAVDVSDTGIMSMRPLQSITIPAGGQVAMTQLSDHIMLMNLKDETKLGVNFPLTLTFKNAGAKQITVEVIKPEEMIKRFPISMMGPNVQKMMGAHQKNAAATPAPDAAKGGQGAAPAATPGATFVPTKEEAQKPMPLPTPAPDTAPAPAPAPAPAAPVAPDAHTGH